MMAFLNTNTADFSLEFHRAANGAEVEIVGRKKMPTFDHIYSSQLEVHFVVRLKDELFTESGRRLGSTWHIQAKHLRGS